MRHRLPVLAIGLTAGIALALSACSGGSTPVASTSADASQVCAKPTKTHGFHTCADIKKAEQEGSVTIYTPTPEAGTAKFVAEFTKLFPQIKTSYVIAQDSASFSKLSAEQQSGQGQADVVNLTDFGIINQFQSQNGYAQYVSPETSVYKKSYKSSPAGLWTWGSLNLSATLYNPQTLPANEVPKDWPDLLDKKFTGKISLRTAASGLSQVQWYELKQKYGEKYWNKFADLKPTGYDSSVQQIDRLTNHQDLVAALGSYSVYLTAKQQGAPVEATFMKSGAPTTADVWGIPSVAPHPQAARLFEDWLLSKEGQEAAVRDLSLATIYPGVKPPTGSVDATKLKLIFPTDLTKFVATRTDFNTDWNRILGLQ